MTKFTLGSVLIAAFFLNSSAFAGQHIATCVGKQNNGLFVRVELELGTPNPREHDPRFRYYAQLTTFRTASDLQAGKNWTSQLESNPLAVAGGNPAVYWNGQSISNPIFKLMVNDKNSLLEVPVRSGMDDPNLAHVNLVCK